MMHFWLALVVIGAIGIAQEKLDNWYEDRKARGATQTKRAYHKPSQYIMTHQDWRE